MYQYKNSEYFNKEIPYSFYSINFYTTWNVLFFYFKRYTYF